MAADKLTKGLPARIILETTIVQDEEVFKNSFDEMGRIVLMNDNYYLRFKESNDDGEDGVATLIKIEQDGVVNLTRHGAQKTRLTFNDEEDTYTKYQTPAGVMQLRVETTRSSISYNDQPFQGEVAIDYVLYSENQPLGTYQLRLRFTT